MHRIFQMHNTEQLFHPHRVLVILWFSPVLFSFSTRFACECNKPSSHFFYSGPSKTCFQVPELVLHSLVQQFLVLITYAENNMLKIIWSVDTKFTKFYVT